VPEIFAQEERKNGRTATLKTFRPSGLPVQSQLFRSKLLERRDHVFSDNLRVVAVDLRGRHITREDNDRAIVSTHEYLLTVDCNSTMVNERLAGYECA
jgi:hypothetical protein